MAKSKRVRKISSRKSKTSSKAKAAREMRDCACGCGGKTLGYFSMGHDARFKGWLLRIERGEATPEQLLKKSVRDAYTWKAKGKGQIPATDYKGQSHSGYDK